MRTLLTTTYALAVALTASPALAGERHDKPMVRTLVMTADPGQETPAIYVAGRVVTVLCFEKEVDPAKTRLLAWEGRFEPLLIGGKKVVLEPLHAFDDAEVQPLLVTLVDGTEFALLVKPWSLKDGEGALDYQVNVYKDARNPDAMRYKLERALEREAALREELEQVRDEEQSVDHALATLLAKGEVKKTLFVSRDRYRMTKADMAPADMATDIEVFTAPGKAAVVVKLKNIKHEGPWRLDSVLLTRATDSTTRPYALRMTQSQIARGESGTIAIVVDKSAFANDAGKFTDLILQVFGGTGRQQVSLMLFPALIQ